MIIVIWAAKFGDHFVVQQKIVQTITLSEDRTLSATPEAFFIPYSIELFPITSFSV